MTIDVMLHTEGAVQEVAKMSLEPWIRECLDCLHAIPTSPLASMTAQEYRQRQMLNCPPNIPVKERQ